MSSSFITTIPLEKGAQLKEYLLSQGFEVKQPPNTLFQGKKEGVTCTLYPSGKLMVQGKDKHDFIVYYLEPEILGTLSYSNPEIYLDMRPKIGVDEAGKGDFFGPLCIAGVYADEKLIQRLHTLGVKDSKKLSDPSILALGRKIKEECPHVVIRISPLRYNEMHQSFGNLNALLGWGHARAIEDLALKTKSPLAVIDQFAHESIVQRALEKKKLPILLEQRHRAEEDLVVAAASILARGAFVEAIDAMGKLLSLEIPKGASAEVIRVGKLLLKRLGDEKMKELVKTHFKTWDEIHRA